MLLWRKNYSVFQACSVAVVQHNVKVWVFGHQPKNNLTLTGKSILTPSPIQSSFGKWHFLKSSLSRWMAPLSFLVHPLFLKSKLKLACLKVMTVGRELFGLRWSKMPQRRTSLAARILSVVILGLLTLSLPQVTKTEFLLTISTQYQAGRWWE